MILRSIVIVGGGQAGFQTAASLRQEGFDGRIVLVDAEAGLPYQRPPLSKAYVQGKMSAHSLVFRPRKFFDDNRIDLVSDRVETLDRATRHIGLASGSRLEYDHLVLCVGAKARRLAAEGATLDGVLELRNLTDAEAIKSRLKDAREIVVIGAGFVGLEFAAVARAAGAAVRVVEHAARPIARAVSQPMSDFVTHAHARGGVAFSFGAAVARIRASAGAVSAVELTDGRVLPADLVMVGIGVEPNTRLAADARLAIDNGVKVDAHLLTNDPRISAIGDCASFPCSRSDRRLRLESVQNASDQARAVAARIVGKPGPYVALPWFWSDQGDQKLQMAGLSDAESTTRVVQPTGSQALSVLLFRREQLVAVECVNRPADFVAGRKLLSRENRLRPADAAQPGFSLRDWEAQDRNQPECTA